MNVDSKERPIRYIRPRQLFDTVKRFAKRDSVTRGEFLFDVPGFLADMEWNHMDQMHRPFIHRTYQDNLRIALGRDFAVSLTRWGRWPILISVTDSRVAEGLYYQDFVLAGIIFVHNIIAMREENEVVHLKLEWIIHSHRFLKPLHRILSRMFYKLNIRLQEEDSVIRRQRYALRKLGYVFRSDPPDYYSSNQMTYHTVYPALPQDAFIDLESLPLDSRHQCNVANVAFLVQRRESETLIWPSACPHEGGELISGKETQDCRLECPWHGLKIKPARLSASHPDAEAYGFKYRLKESRIFISQSAMHVEDDVSAPDIQDP